MLYDFHTHTCLSDGALTPVELIRRAIVNGYDSIGVTDHAAPGTMERIIHEVTGACAFARAHWKILAIPGIELTHAPPAAIDEAARKAKELGAWIVVVHGETIVEPVEKGTNLAALRSPSVDILAHPGLLTPEEAELAASGSVFLEISARKGHSLTNGHVAALGQRAGARLLLDSDTHAENDLLTADFAARVARGAGLGETAVDEMLAANPRKLLARLPSR